MQMRKNCTFSNVLQKVKSYFFANIYPYTMSCRIRTVFRVRILIQVSKLPSNFATRMRKQPQKFNCHIPWFVLLRTRTLHTLSDSLKLNKKPKRIRLFLCGILNLQIRIWIQNSLELLDPDPDYGSVTLGEGANLLRGYRDTPLQTHLCRGGFLLLPCNN
jgi:hypothetical protein